MRLIPYMIYLGFAVGAAKKVWKTLQGYRSFRIQYTLADQMFGLDAYRVVLGFVKTKDMGMTVDGESVKMRITMTTGLVKTFYCRSALGYIDAITKIRRAMDKHLAKYYPEADLSYEIYRYIPSRKTAADIDEATWKEFWPIYDSFMSIPRHL